MTISFLAAAAAGHPGRIDWGDVPTWLAVIGAIAAALIAFGQLNAQRKDIARQTRLLERQQANDIDIKWQIGRMEFIPVRLPGLPLRTPADSYIMAAVSNNSRRPITEVICWTDSPTGSATAARVVGRLLYKIPQDATPAFGEQVDSDRASLIRKGHTYGFVFAVLRIQGQEEPRFTARFTDDDGQRWQIDPNLHLKKLGRRDR